MVTSSQIRQHVLARAGAEKARIRSTGAVEVFGTMPNTNKRGWYFAGWKEEAARQISAEQEMARDQ